METLTLREWRMAKEISQESMAEVCGIHVNTYRNWEKNPKEIPISKAYKIALALGVRMDQILFEANTTKCSVASSSVG